MTGSKKIKNSFFCIVLFQAVLLFFCPLLFAYPVEFTDSGGNSIYLENKPSRVVSLVPGLTEIIMALGAGDSLHGITYHSTKLQGAENKNIMGGFLSPNPDLVEEIRPDVIFHAGLQKGIIERFSDSDYKLINLEVRSLEDSFDTILLMGSIFGAESKAESMVRDIRDQLELIKKKIDNIPMDRRKRVIRLMGVDPVMTVGDDSFQNEMIRAAGGIPPVLRKKGQAVPITMEEWMEFNPQVIYGCGGSIGTWSEFLDQPGWRDVAAVRKNMLFNFPCDLTCRAATHTGYFVTWLSARTYMNEFSSLETRVREDGITGSRSLDIVLPYVRDAAIEESLINDFKNKSLVIEFNRPLSIVSTLEGYRQGIETTINHYISPAGWVVNHNLDMTALKLLIFPVIHKTQETAASLFTGADMDHLSIKKARYREMEVYALVTAGVTSNAMRMGKDSGLYYEPGTINIIILPNMRLSQRAMTRAIISVTEAKTAALQDMDIRSSYSPMPHQATGTGTDNVIIVEGDGRMIDNSGGHTKMGELIASTVYQGVREAVHRQNNIIAERDVFQRLMERKINLHGSTLFKDCDCGITKPRLAGEMEKLLLMSEYSAFITSSLALSDSFEKGLVSDLAPFELWCRSIAEKIAGKKIDNFKDLTGHHDIPPVMRMSLNALINGIYHRNETETR